MGDLIIIGRGSLWEKIRQGRGQVIRVGRSETAPIEV
jgi:hypothetical protein